MSIDRRGFLAAGAALLAAVPVGAAERTASPLFPVGFLWGAATAGHQVEGNNTTSDIWLLENVKPTIFAEPSGDGVNSFELWPQDLDLVRTIGLNTYRFSLEWARIEPEEGFFSAVMLDHYKAIIAGCRERGITPMVTFNHFTVPRWFAAKGGWTNPQAPTLFARFCERAARHVAADIGYATTLNEPQLLRLLRWAALPPQLLEAQRTMLAAAAKAMGAEKFVAANAANEEDVDLMQTIMIAAHKAGRSAIKSVRSDLPVGVSLAINDDHAVGRNSRRDAKRADVYGAWLDAVKGDDFVGVQNYTRVRYDSNGVMGPSADTEHNMLNEDIYPPSLAGAVRYVYEQTKVPIMITEHGFATDNDEQRAAFIPPALKYLKDAIDDGVPVLGYIHWSLLDNFEWIWGYKIHYGLATVDRKTFKRTLKPSAAVLGAIARRNSL